MEAKSITGMIIGDANIHTFKMPKFVGGYRLGKGAYSFKLNLEHRPNWFQQKMMKLCFGISWEDDE